VGSHGSDAFAGLRGKEVFGVSGEMTLSAEVPTNTMLTLNLSLNLSGQSKADFLASASSVINTPSGFGIPQRVPVFDLPEGFTANSPSLLLVDNFVPEPSSSAASLAAVAGLFALLHQRRSARKWTATLR
jgi:hypothetical protein